MLRHSHTGKTLAKEAVFFKSASDRAKGMLRYAECPPSLAAIFYLPLCGFFPVIHTFGMQFAIDVAFCNSSKQILYLYRNVQPGKMLCPWKKILGGLPFLVEFAGCDLGALKVGDVLEW